MSSQLQKLTTSGMNCDGEGLVLLTAVTITEVSPNCKDGKNGGGNNTKIYSNWIVLKLPFVHVETHELLGIWTQTIKPNREFFLKSS